MGSHIVKQLTDRGNKVAIIDNFSSGSKQNLQDLGINQECIVGDLRDPSFAKSSLKNVECVYHFAAEVGSVQYLHGSGANELAAFQSNNLIDTNTFRACIENGIKRILYASSVSVYPFKDQMKAGEPFREEDSQRVVDPEGGYGWSKYIAEKQLEMMSGISVGIARIFHAYGKNIYLKPDRSQVIASLIRKAIRYPKEGFVIWGDGNQRRCFVHIDDALLAFAKMEDYLGHNDKITINIGSQEEISVLELARKIIGLSKKKIDLEFDPKKPTGALFRKPSIDRANRLLDWKPIVPFDEGLKSTFEWAENRLELGAE